MHVEFTLYDGRTIALQSDSKKFELALQRLRTDKTTGNVNIEWKGFSYHPTLEQALHKVATLKVRSSSTKSLKSLKHDLEQVRLDIIETWQVHYRKLEMEKLS
jgi:hypothetical protein